MSINKTQDIINEVSKVVTGKEIQIKKALAAIIAGGHILIEDVPGVGKTTLATSFSKVMSLKNNRVQFTPDVMPADILGFNMYDKNIGKFVYHNGTIMCNLFLADEINRTSPKTQSALLEVMEEGKVTVDGVTRKVPEPFIVIATQNPKGSAGTQLLPESQLDRFMICMSMGYPDFKHEVEIAKGKAVKNDVDLSAVISSEALVKMQEEAADVYIHNNIYCYITKLVALTRENPYIELGVSPRGTIALTRMVKAWAYINERNYVTPQDVTDVFSDVTKHRIVLNTKARVTHISEETVLKEIVDNLVSPVTYRERVKYDN
ncbi:MAG: MoxR family ATPase [Clostridiales bacterium]|nr:MoxR family ATPase [Clostridiales bacterium]